MGGFHSNLFGLWHYFWVQTILARMIYLKFTMENLKRIYSILILSGKGFYCYSVDQDSLLSYYIGLSIRLFGLSITIKLSGLSIRLFELSTLSEHFFLGLLSTYHYHLEQIATSFEIVTGLFSTSILEI